MLGCVGALGVLEGVVLLGWALLGLASGGVWVCGWFLGLGFGWAFSMAAFVGELL